MKREDSAKNESGEEEGDGFWSEGSFAETPSPEDSKEKMKTFRMKHDEDMRFNCKACKAKISAHNKDWHGGMCDDCFDSKYFPDVMKKRN